MRKVLRQRYGLWLVNPVTGARSRGFSIYAIDEADARRQSSNLLRYVQANRREHELVYEGEEYVRKSEPGPGLSVGSTTVEDYAEERGHPDEHVAHCYDVDECIHKSESR